MSVILLYLILFLPLQKLAIIKLYRRNKLILPDFIGIGAQKAGTSWLHANLMVHQQVFMPKEKELHYFDRDFEKPLSFYSSYFEKAEHMIKGEITPAYSTLPEFVIQQIHSHMPELKILFIMRNPVDRAWSKLKMALINRNIEIETLSENLMLQVLKDPLVTEKGKYSLIIRQWEKFFAKNMKILFFESIINSPQELLTETFSFLGLDKNVDWSLFPYKSVINSTTPHIMPSSIKRELYSLYKDEILTIHEIFGNPVDSWVREMNTVLD